MKFNLWCWDQVQYVKNWTNPYEEIAPELEKKAAVGIDTMLVYVKSDFPLDIYIKAARCNGLKIQAWVVPMHLILNPICRTLPESQWTEFEKNFKILFRGVCLNHPYNQDQCIKTIQNLIDTSGDLLTGVHLDYFRNDNAVFTREYPCECEACCDMRLRFFGHKTLSKDDLENPAVMYKELQQRNANVTSIVGKIRNITNHRKLILSMAARANYLNSIDITNPPVWGLGPAVYEGQDWVEWADSGLIDYISTMNYHTDQNKFDALFNDHLRLLADSPVNFYPGIAVDSSMGYNPPAQVEQYIEKVKNANLKGCTIFIRSDILSQEHEYVIRNAQNK